MKINYKSIVGGSERDLREHYNWLSSYLPWDNGVKGDIMQDREPPEGFEQYHCIDVLGPEFVWLNETFTDDKYTWYLWFESVFLVPEDMAAFLKLKWK